MKSGISALHIITGLSRGGAEAMLVKVLAAADRERFRHSVVSLTNEGVHGPKIRALGVPLQCLGMRPDRPGLSSLLHLRRFVSKADPELVHGWMYHGILAAHASARGRPIVAGIRHSLHDLDAEKRGTRLVIRACALTSRRFAALTYNSAVSLEQHAAIGFDRSRASVIPNGFDTGLLRPDPERRARMRAAFGLAPDQVAVLHLARLHPMKDHAGLLAAIRVMDDPRLVFLLAGTGVTPGNPPFSESPDARIRLLGERDDVPDLLQAADMLVNASWSEAFPNVLGEAMACGVPCIATDVGDSAYIIGDSGIIVPPRDREALADAVLRLAALTPSERQAMGAMARARIVENFSIARVVGQYQTLYETILSERRNKNG